MRKHNYVVGFLGDRQCVYGKFDKDERSWVDLLTLSQAKKRINDLSSSPRSKRAIYELKLLRVID